MLISVIIPVYNVSKHLGKCLDTVLNQTFKDFEIIAIDDNSTDNSYEILKEYSKKDSRIIIFKNPHNIGAARTRNIGIQLARGKYLTILDSDDFFEYDFLEKMFNEAENTNSDLVLCSFYKYVDNIKKDLLYNFSPVFLNKKLTNPFNPQIISKELFKIFAGFAVVPFNKLILRSWLIENDIYFQDLPNSNDVYFGSAVLIHAIKISYLDKPFIHKRTGWGGNIENHRHKNPYSFYYALKKLYGTLKNFSEFNIYLSSFNTYVIDSVRYIFSILKPKEQEEFLKFWQNEGFLSLNMINLSEKDFMSPKFYYQWRLLSEKSFISYDDFGIAAKNVYENFFRKLSEKNYKAAVWGYGLEGKSFVKMAEICNYNLIEAYDKDKNKHQDEPISVKFFENRNKKVNAVIVTNTVLIKDISKDIKNTDKNIKIFDFGAFLEYGISFNDCEI